MAKYGVWRGPYEEGTLYFYLDEYLKDAPKDLMAVLGGHCANGWKTRAKKETHAGGEEHRRPRLACCSSIAAERALLLYGTLARYQRDLRGLLVEFKVSNAQEAYAALAQHGRRSTRRTWPRRCGPARAWSAWAWSRTSFPNTTSPTWPT